jgi:putative lipoprotein
MIGFGALSALLTVAAASQTQFVTGSVAYRERMALPPTAEVVVSLDRFVEDASGTQEHINISEVRMKLGGKQVPVQFSLPYARETVTAGSKLGIRAVIRVDGEVLFESAKTETVVTNGKRKIDLILVRAMSMEMPPLTNVTWELMGLDSQALKFETRRPTLRFDAETGQLRGFSGVNSFGGTFEYKAPTIQIDPGAMTMMAGPPERMEVESRLMQILPSVTRATIQEGELVLSRGEKELARFRVAKKE